MAAVKLSHRKIKLKAKGANVAPPAIPLDKDPSVLLEIGNSDGFCWQATFSTAVTNANGVFDARSD